jgi:hypothetical protein
VIRAAALLALAAAGPAGAVGMSEDLTRCASFWYGVADFRDHTPNDSQPADALRETARAFRDRAVAIEGAPEAVDAAIARDRPDMARLTEAYTFGADPESIGLWERTAQRCEMLASSQAG